MDSSNGCLLRIPELHTLDHFNLLPQLLYDIADTNRICCLETLKKARWLRPHELDLTWEAELIATYEATEEEQPTSFWSGMAQMVDFRGLCRGSVTISRLEYIS